MAQSTPKLTEQAAQAHRRQIEAERTNALDRLIAISDSLSRAELLQSLSRLRISEVKSFITDHLKHNDIAVRRAAYFGLASLSFVDPREWVPSQLSALHDLAHQDRVALCDALAHSLHPRVGDQIFRVATHHHKTLQVSERSEVAELETLEHCLSAAIATLHVGHPLKITYEQAKAIADLNPLSPSGERSLLMISKLIQAPHLLLGEDRAVILEFFRGVMHEIAKATDLSIIRYPLLSLDPSELLSMIAPWWGVGQISSNNASSEDQKTEHLKKRLSQSARIMGSKQSAPLSPLMIQKWLDQIEHGLSNAQQKGTQRSQMWSVKRADVIPYLKLIRSLLRQKRLPKPLAREARRGLRLFGELQSRPSVDRVLITHAVCHLSALIDHSVRRLRKLPRCLNKPDDLPLIYLLSREVMSHWGSHQQTKALQALYRLHQQKGESSIFGLELLTETLVSLSPLGRRKEWQISRIKEALKGASLIAQIAIEAIAEHRLSRLQGEVYDRVLRALEQDEYAVVTVGIKCLESLDINALQPISPTLKNHNYPELRLLGHALEARYPRLIPAPSGSESASQVSAETLLKEPQLAWGKRSSARRLTIKLERGSIELSLSPSAFNLIKTLELAVAHRLFETGIVTQKGDDKVTFSARLDRPWSGWLYPPRSEPSDKLNPLALHQRWVLTWDPLIYDHYRTGWVLSRSADALTLIKHGVIAEVIEGGELLETMMIGDRSLSAELK